LKLDAGRAAHLTFEDSVKKFSRHMLKICNGAEQNPQKMYVHLLFAEKRSAMNM
jgi:hypothetical protein